MTDPDEQPNPTEQAQALSFEGDVIAELEGRLPALVVEMPEAYARGTHLRLNVEVRIKSVRHEENRKGELVRSHVMALESINLVSSFNPADAADTTGGNSGGPQRQTPDEAEELGLEIGRSSDTWENPPAVGF